MSATLFWIGIGILGFIVVVGILMSLPMVKGWFGETMVRMVLKSLPSDNYSVLNDVKFYGKETNPSSDPDSGKRWSCQIDHLVVSHYGIFCIETKNYLGTIYGNYSDKYLHRKVLGMSYDTYSPVYQNYRHLQRLVQTFPLIKSHSQDLHSIVCFMPGGNPKIKGKGAATICKLYQLKKEILKYKKHILTSDEYYAIVDAVKAVSRNHL